MEHSNEYDIGTEMLKPGEYIGKDYTGKWVKLTLCPDNTILSTNVFDSLDALLKQCDKLRAIALDRRMQDIRVAQGLGEVV